MNMNNIKSYYDIKKKFIKKTFLDYENDDFIEDNIEYKYFNFKKNDKSKKIEKLFSLINDNKNNINKITEEFVKICSIVYYDKVFLKKIFHDNIYLSDDYNKSKYFIMFNNKKTKLIVVFRGTNYFENIIKNLKFYRTKFEFIDEKEINNFIKWRDDIIENEPIFDSRKVPLYDDKDIELHAGFYEESVSIFKELFPIIIKILGNSILSDTAEQLEIIFTGHSLGGSLASIIVLLFKKFIKDHMKLLNKKFKNIKTHCVVINTPALGNKNFNLLKFYYDVNNYYYIHNIGDNLITWGYKFTLLSTKKMRHTDYMFKDEKKKDKVKICKTNYYNIDYTTYLKKKYLFLKRKYNSLKINDILFYHNCFQLPNKKKIMVL